MDTTAAATAISIVTRRKSFIGNGSGVAAIARYMLECLLGALLHVLDANTFAASIVLWKVLKFLVAVVAVVAVAPSATFRLFPSLV